jgi:glycerol-3-phosphate O-acyltransferase
VTLTLLGTGNRALTVDETLLAMRNLLDYVVRRKLPTTTELEDLEVADGVRRALAALESSGVVSCYDEGPEAVYAIERDQHHAAAYYRNSIAHFFMCGAISELALLTAAQADPQAAADVFFAEALRLRDLLKFDFFFSDKESFQRELREELAFHHRDWEARLQAGGAEVRRMIQGIRPFSAHRVLRPFLDAYDVVADALARRGTAEPFDKDDFVDGCLRLGRQYLLQGRVRSPESVSKALFETALRLAANRDLVEPPPLEVAGLAGRRRAFATEVQEARRRVEIVEALAAARRAGLS